MVPLIKTFKPRRVSRRRDFAPANHAAPPLTKQLSRAYYKKNTAARYRWVAIAATLLLLAGLAALIYAPIFRIQNVIINNVGFAPTEKRLQEMLFDFMKHKRWYILPQSNLIFFSSQAARRILAQEFYIEEVDFIKHWPNVLKVNVAKNVIIAVLKTDQGEFLVNRQGMLIQQLYNDTDDNTKTLPLVIERQGPLRNLGEVVMDAMTAAFVDELYHHWQQELPDLSFQYLLFDKASLPTIQVYMPEGWYVNITREAPVGVQIESLKRLLQERIKADRQKLQYIDVRFGNRLYFKLK